MSDNFDLKKYLIENKATTNSRMLNEYFEKESDSLEQAFQKAGVDMSKPITAVKISGHIIDDSMQEDPKSFLKKLEVEKAELEEEEGEAVIYDYDAVDSYPAEDMNLPSTMVPKLSVMFSDSYEYVIYQEEGMAEMKKKHSKMMNEAIEAKAWLVDEEDGFPSILRFASIEAAKDAQFDEMADDPYNRPLFTSLEDLKKYLDDQYMADYDVEKYRFVK